MCKKEPACSSEKQRLLVQHYHPYYSTCSLKTRPSHLIRLLLCTLALAVCLGATETSATSHSGDLCVEDNSNGEESFCTIQSSTMAGDGERERTFIMIKPDGVHRGLVGEIVKRFEQKGFHLVAMKFMWVSQLSVHETKINPD